MRVGVNEEDTGDRRGLCVVGAEVDADVIHYPFQVVSGVEEFEG